MVTAPSLRILCSDSSAFFGVAVMDGGVDDQQVAGWVRFVSLLFL